VAAALASAAPTIQLLMTVLRLLLAWLVLLAIPVQGFAAATMLYCAEASAGPAWQMAMGDDAAPGHPMHAAEEDRAAPATGQDKLPHPGRKSAAHGSCCLAVAIDAAAPAPSLAPAPDADLQEPLLPVHSQPAGVLDRPPRA
jgi:hypothetical protein